MLTELLGFDGYFVKEVKKENNTHILSVESENLPVCPNCKQTFLGAPKDIRYQRVEDLSVFGKRCFLDVPKYRISCSCGYKGTEEIPWLDPYNRTTNRFSSWIYEFCKRMTCIDVARIFGISKHTVYRMDKTGIQNELSKQKELFPETISVDEISRKKGHVYATIVSAPGIKKVLDVLKGRKKEALEGFFEAKGRKWCEKIKLACMDAWWGFRTPTEKYCKKAKIAFDHFHLAQHFSKAIDKVRIAEYKKASEENKPLFKGARWLLLKRPEKLKENQQESLDVLLKANQVLLTVYLLRGEFRQVFSGYSARSKIIRLTKWINRAKSANIPQLHEFIRNVEKWRPYINNALRENVSNSYAEGLNAKIRVIQRMAYGYKDFEYLRLKIIQQFNFRGIQSIFDT